MKKVYNLFLQETRTAHNLSCRETKGFTACKFSPQWVATGSFFSSSSFSFSMRHFSFLGLFRLSQFSSSIPRFLLSSLSQTQLIEGNKMRALCLSKLEESVLRLHYALAKARGFFKPLCRRLMQAAVKSPFSRPPKST